jgi:hypothetical protein
MSYLTPSLKGGVFCFIEYYLYLYKKKTIMNTYQFKGKRVYTENFIVELECETLEEAQKIIDDGKYEDNIISSAGSEDVDLSYIGFETYIDF